MKPILTLLIALSLQANVCDKILDKAIDDYSKALYVKTTQSRTAYSIRSDAGYNLFKLCQEHSIDYVPKEVASKLGQIKNLKIDK